MKELHNATRKVLNNMSPEELAKYAVKSVDYCLEAVDSGRSTREECDKDVDLFVKRHVETLELNDYIDYLKAVTNESGIRLTRKWAIEHLDSLELRIQLLEVGILDSIHRDVDMEQQYYMAYDIDTAAAKTQEHIEQTRELIDSLYQAIWKLKEERNQFLSPSYWERIGGVPEREPPTCFMWPVIKRIYKDFDLDSYMSAGTVAE